MIIGVRHLRFLAVTLVVAFLWVGGAASAQVFGHLGHHAQHQSSSHASIVCSWLCAAGQAVDSMALSVDSATSPVAVMIQLPIAPPPYSVIGAFLSRGPPSNF